MRKHTHTYITNLLHLKFAGMSAYPIPLRVVGKMMKKKLEKTPAANGKFITTASTFLLAPSPNPKKQFSTSLSLKANAMNTNKDTNA